MAEYDALDQSAWIIALRSRGRGVHRIPINARALNRDLSDDFNDSSVDTWTHHNHPMKIQGKRRNDASLLITCDIYIIKHDF